MRLRIQRCNLTTATVVAALIALLALLVGVEETASRAIGVSVYRRDASPEALFAESASVEKREAPVVLEERSEPAPERRLERRQLKKAQVRRPRVAWDAGKIAAKRAAVGGNARAQRDARRDQRINRTKGAKEKRAKRAKEFQKKTRVNAWKRQEAYNKSMKNSRKNKKANKVIDNWINTAADKKKRKEKYRAFIDHLKVDPKNVNHGGHRYTPELVKKLPAGTTAKRLGPGRVQLTIPKGGGKNQIKSVFLAAGDYAGMGVDGIGTVSSRHGYSRKKMNALARQGLAQEIQNPMNKAIPGSEERVVQQGGGYPDITMKVYPPNLKGKHKNKGTGTAYPINRR
ncbi:hypothetical protein HDU96_007439 [Phlyctochytrium bullatum]|nr:hypothetical protein HDU96_007439 [Phlyctochytrium bullatum]